MWTWIKRIVVSPVFENDEDKTRIASLLNVVLWVLLVGSVLVAIIDKKEGRSLGIVLGFLMIGMLVLMRLGYIKVTGILVSIILFGIASAAVYFDGTVRTSGMSVYIFAIVCATLLGGSRVGIAFTVLSLLVSYGMLQAELHADWFPDPAFSSLGGSFVTWLVFAMMFVLSGVVLWLTNRSLNRALARSRANETVLSNRNQELQDVRTTLEQTNAELRTAVEQYGDHMAEVGRGNLSRRLTLSADTIGGDAMALHLLGQQLNGMTVSLEEMAQAAKCLAIGDVGVDIKPQSEHDVLGSAFAQMIAYQRAMADVAGRLATGDMGVNVTPQSDKDVLGQAFAQMVRYQQQMAATASRLAQGDLTVVMAPQSAADVLGNAFAQMVASQRVLVGQIQSSAGEVALAAQQITQSSEQSAGATGQVAGAMQQIARGAAQQTERMTQTSAMVQQVSHAIEGVARGAQEQSIAVTQASNVTARISGAIEAVVANAHTGADSAARAALTAQSGAQTIETTIQGMQTIKQTQDEARRKVAEMGMRAEEIGVIVTTIEKIADQTNLLALNAAIEAARAGAYGKGFAVVADEVRRLAENAGRATQEIVALVKGIQKSVAEAVQAMQAGAVEVDSGVTRSREAGRALADILGAVGLVNQQMTDIAHAAQRMGEAAQEMVNAVESVSAVVEENTAATEEMASSSEEVLGSIEEIAGISEENSASVEEVSASVEEVSAQAEEVTASAETLREMAQGLQQLVARFRLSA